MPHLPLGEQRLGQECPDGPDGFFRFLSLKYEHRSRVHQVSSQCGFIPLLSLVRTVRSIRAKIYGKLVLQLYFSASLSIVRLALA
jgi:hypothetical protein